MKGNTIIPKSDIRQDTWMSPACVAAVATASTMAATGIRLAQSYEEERVKFELMMASECPHMSLDRDESNKRNYKWRAVQNMWQGWLLCRGMLK